jgi:hypothetical protein
LVGSKNYAEPLWLSSGGLLLSIEKPGKRGVLRDVEPGEPETTAGHEMRVAAGSAGPPDHGTPDNLSGERERAEGRWEFEGARRARPQKIEMLDPGAVTAEIEEAHLLRLARPRGRPVD